MATPQISFDLGNDLPLKIKGTAANVEGSRFTPCSHVELSVHLGSANGRALAHATVPVANDGSFLWGTLLLLRGAPLGRYACGAEMTVVVHDSATRADSTKTANVYCPG